MSTYQYRKSHCGYKTIVRSFYLHNGISYTGRCHLYIESGPWFRWYVSGGHLWGFPLDRLISTMGFPILVRCHLYIESGPWFRWSVSGGHLWGFPLMGPGNISCLHRYIQRTNQWSGAVLDLALPWELGTVTGPELRCCFWLKFDFWLKSEI